VGRGREQAVGRDRRHISAPPLPPLG